MKSLPLGKKILFALGQLGWSLASFGVGNLMVYFFLPPEEAGKAAMFPSWFFPGLIAGVFTVIGLITALARLFDAVTNPLVAHWSDTSRSPLGRRRKFMAISAVPFGLLSIAVFFPPVAGESWVNILALALSTLAFYLFFVMYATPYTALLSELGHNPRERLFLSTIISVTWALGFAIGQQVYLFQGILEATGLTPLAAFQTVIVVFGAASVVLMLLPVFFIDERKYALPGVSDQSVGKALGATLRNRDFTWYISSELIYFVCLTMIQMGMLYFITVLLGLPKERVSLLMLVMFLFSFLCYPVVNILGNRWGKKRLLTVGFVIFGLDFAACALMGILPVPADAFGWAIALGAAIPMAIFGILPNALVADIAEADGITTGQPKAGIFFGVRNFEMNLGVSLANMLFPTFLAWGMASGAQALGVRLAAVVAAVLCLIGLVLFQRYRESDVLAVLAKKSS